MKRKTYPVIVTLIFLLMSWIIGCSNEKNGEKPPVIIPVTVEKTELKPVSIPVRSSGRLQPKIRIKLSYKTGGIIEKISAEEGDSVQKGQVLASLNLAEIKARVSTARNALQKAQRDLKRVKNLYQDRAATLEQFQNAKTAEEVARSNMEIARFNLDHSVIRAPSVGKILKRLAEVNEVIGPGQPVFFFGSTENQWVVIVGVPERDAVRLELNDPGEVRFDAYPGRVFQATVSEISQAVDPASGTIEVELEIRSRESRLMSGFIALVDIFPEKKDQCLLIPVDALVDSEGLRGYVFVPDGTRARKIEIRIMHLFPERVAVAPDSDIPNRVITAGSDYLSDGMSIKIVE